MSLRGISKMAKPVSSNVYRALWVVRQGTLDQYHEQDISGGLKGLPMFRAGDHEYRQRRSGFPGDPQ
jgi:hypothetical protein